MYAAQNGYIFIGESLLLVLSKLTFLLAKYRFDVQIFLSCNIFWLLYDLFVDIYNSLRKVIIRFSRNLHSFLIPIEHEPLYL